MNEETILLQKKWLIELRNPEITKVTGTLNTNRPMEFCALGVGAYVQDLLENKDLSLTTIGQSLGISESVVDYIISMNDGDIVVKETPDGVVDQLACGCCWQREYTTIRKTMKQRSFEFIARWLEIYFALQNRSVV